MKINFRDFLNLMTVSFFTLLLVACGNDSEDESNSGDEGSVTENWPHDEVTFIVPFDAGGSVDTMARGLAPYLEDELGTSITVENHPGASAQLGSTQFINSPDDGSVFFVGTQLYLSANIELQNADFNIEDFSMANYEQYDPVTITVHNNSPYETIDDLMADIEDNPGEISYSTISGGSLHLTGVLMEDLLDIDVNPVFYDGGGDIRNALLGEHVDFMIGNANGDQAIAENTRVLAVASDDEEVLSMYPDVVSFNEAFSAYDEEIPYVGSARFIAAHTSFKEENPELFQQFVDAYEAMFNSEEYQAHLAEQSADVVSSFMGPEESDELNLELHDLVIEYGPDLQSDTN